MLSGGLPSEIEKLQKTKYYIVLRRLSLYEERKKLLAIYEEQARKDAERAAKRK